MNEAWSLTAVDALAAMRAKDLSPVELLESVIARAEAAEPIVNAFAERRYEQALEAASASADRYANGARIRPLEGLPLALKEEVPVRGWRMRHGSVAIDEVAEITSPLAERILKAGAVVHARTTTPELSCAGFTHSELWGVTRNPWNTEVTAGGSSGGSGASLAAGSSMLASGSDIGGSIRLPASMNGVVGFKPPHGRVPVDPPFNLDRYCHDGPMARTVTDCAAFENVLAGPHPMDVTSLRPKLRIPSTLKPIDGWRVAVCVSLGAWDVDEEVAANTRAVGDALAEAGATVVEVELPWTMDQVKAAARRHFGMIAGAEIAEHVAAHPDQVSDYVEAWAVEATTTLAEPGAFLRGLEAEQAMWEPLGELFRRSRAVIAPTWAVTGIPAGDSFLGELTPDGGPNDRQYSVMMTTPFNILSPCPVLAVPSGVASNGVPTGVQIVGRTYSDVDVFRIGAALERVRPWTGLAPLSP
ncbi:MAG TPA: amidase [Actinomycetota bacterium]|jgi:Asp-tRNA(Asn)/Glu-tRNA(Gln) amidotransferase A subunit family amidase|nr:amidase [Actinomycetota bacterium]